MDIQKAIAALIDGKSLTRQQMHDVMTSIMTGTSSEAQIAGFLVALRIKGETVEEITAAAEVMRELSTKVEVQQDSLVDIVGTGGDGAKIFNVSTASAFVAAAAGCNVAKHGNRSVSSSSGSADLLEAAGVCLDIEPESVARCIEQVGLGFMFAVNHHSAMKYAIGPRKQLAVRTVFNMLGPMTNPAGVKRQLLGVYDSTLLQPIAEAMRELGSEHLMVVHSDDGLDEISIAAPTQVCELKSGEIKNYKIQPAEYGLPAGELKDLVVKDATDSLNLIRAAFSKEVESSSKMEKQKIACARDMISLNAGAAIYIGGVASNLTEGIAIASDCIASGQANQKIVELAETTQLLKR